MPDFDDTGQNLRDEQVVDPGAEIPARVASTSPGPALTRTRPEGQSDRGGADLRIDETETEEGTLPPPKGHRADTMVRGVAPDARQEMEHGGVFRNQASFTKGVNAPTVDQSRYQYTTEQMDELTREAPRGLFPDTPGGDGATPLSADRTTFLATMGDRGHFPSLQETEKWARAVFNALRQCAIEAEDPALATEFATVVRVGEAPEVQVEEMMWGGDFVDRVSRALSCVQSWNRQHFYEQVAESAGETIDDPWVDAAVHSYLGTLKSFIGDAANRLNNLGEIQEIWDRV